MEANGPFVVGFVAAKWQISNRTLVPTARGEQPRIVGHAQHGGERDGRQVVVVVRSVLVRAVLHRELDAEPRASNLHRLVEQVRGIEVDRDAERAARRESWCLIALGRAHAATLDRMIDQLARGIGHQRFRIDPRLKVPGARDRGTGQHDVAVRILQPDPELAVGRVDLRALVDRAVDVDRDRGLVGEPGDEPDPRVLQLEAVIATDECDVRIVLDRDVLEPHESERLPHEGRLGRIARLGHPLLDFEDVGRRLDGSAFGLDPRGGIPVVGRWHRIIGVCRNRNRQGGHQNDT